MQCIAFSDDAETDRNIEIVKPLLEVGADPEFCDTKTMFTNTSASSYARNKGKSKLAPQKQASGISPRVIGLALLFGAIGATLVAIGIIPEIAAIGLIATAVLLGIAGAVLGGTVGYLTDTTVNKCYSEAAVQAT